MNSNETSIENVDLSDEDETYVASSLSSDTDTDTTAHETTKKKRKVFKYPIGSNLN